MDAEPLLLAIKPGFADLILLGRKTYEYRRTVRRAKPGAIILLYATSPISAVVGHFTAGEVLIDSPSGLWDMTARRGGIRRSEFSDYFSGATQGCAVEVKDAVRWVVPWGIPELRRLLPGFHPPRCVQSLRPDSPLVTQALIEGNNGHNGRRKIRGSRC